MGMNYIGIDVSKLTLDVWIQGKSYKLSNDLKGFKRIERLIEPGDICVMEATGPYYFRSAHYMNQQGYGVCVINPLVIKRFSQMRMIRAKTDKADAKLIAQYGALEQPKLWQPPSDVVLHIQQEQTTIEGFAQQKQALTNRLEAFQQINNPSKEALRQIKKHIRGLEKTIASLEMSIEEKVNKHYSELMVSLTSIPAIGKKTAALLIAATYGFEKFESSKQLSSYLGVCPRVFESGTSVKGSGRICKMGMSRIRATLYVCSWTAIAHNKACRDLYNRLLAKGKPKKLALIAVVNKLLKQAFAIATKNEHYREMEIVIK